MSPPAGPSRDGAPETGPVVALNPGGNAVEIHLDHFVSNLGDIIACTAAELGANGKLVLVDGRALAAVGDHAKITALSARVGAPGSLAELIATIIAARPSGLLVLGGPDRRGALALMLRDGAAVGVVAAGELGQCASWVLEFHRRRVGSTLWLTEPSGVRIDPCRTFLLEHALDAISRCDVPGASLLWMTGALCWISDELPTTAACDAGFLLLELARRSDEGPRVEAAIGDLDRVVVPTSRPGARPAKPVERRAPAEDEEQSWDFFDDPDPAAEAEWLDARHVFECCDGMTSIEALVERAMIGRFRTFSAVLALLERGHVTLTELPCLPEPSDALADLIADLGEAVA